MAVVRGPTARELHIGERVWGVSVDRVHDHVVAEPTGQKSVLDDSDRNIELPSQTCRVEVAPPTHCGPSCHLQSLPDDVLNLILENLDPVDIGHLSMTSRAWYHALASEHVWNALYNNHIDKFSFMVSPWRGYTAKPPSISPDAPFKQHLLLQLTAQHARSKCITPAESTATSGFFRPLMDKANKIQARWFDRSKNVPLLGLPGSGHWCLLEKMMWKRGGDETLKLRGLQAGVNSRFAGISFDITGCYSSLNIQAIKVTDIALFRQIGNQFAQFLRTISGLIFVVNSCRPSEFFEIRRHIDHIIPDAPVTAPILFVCYRREHGVSDPTGNTADECKPLKIAQVIAGLHLNDLQHPWMITSFGDKEEFSEFGGTLRYFSKHLL